MCDIKNGKKMRTLKFDRSVKLLQPSLLDFTVLKKSDDVKIVIYQSRHKFARDAAMSGTDVMTGPIFGSCVYINGVEFSNLSFGLPFMRFKQGSRPKITYVNETKFTFNIHYHGLETMGSIDGTSMEVVFGPSTQLGPQVTFQFPEITNNQSLLWFHSHNMFISMELIYGGLVGLLQIVDKATAWLTKRFVYADNQLLLTALDMDLTSTGTQTDNNLVTDGNRSNFTIINGTSVLNWYSSSSSVPFINPLVHETTKNLVKIDILNASLNWRVFYIGVCDEDLKIKSFYLVQTDSGLMNPTKLKMTLISVASRIGIIIDLNKFKHHIAYLFFYNYDLTEIFDSTSTFPDEPTNPTITGTIPDLQKSNNATPYPTPIPDPNEQNQQGNYTNLDYPQVPLIPQTNQILTNGSVNVPKKYCNIKPFLKISLSHHCHLSLADTLVQIRQTIFGQTTYDLADCILNQPGFEYNPKFNYLSFLNPNYYSSLPQLTSDVPIRNLFLFSETNLNAIDTNPDGTTEYVDGANRIMVDLWNSQELDLDWALRQYTQAPNNYKPTTLPTSKFRIYKTDDRYSNTAMISNDTLVIQIFNSQIAYGDLTQVPLTTAVVIFPPTPACQLLNLQQWIDLVNQTFRQTIIQTVPPITVSQLLQCDWSFFPYALNFIYQKTSYIKSAVIKTNNSSKYWIRLLGRWPLLQFFGKPLTGSTLDTDNDLLTQLRTKRNQQRTQKNQSKSQSGQIKVKKTVELYVKCDEVGIYGIYDAAIQQIFPFYATNSGDVQLPIACMKRNAELIISPNSTYLGLYDGYLNDNLKSFSVRFKSTENWIYTNGDNTDAHPLHFHLTSGYTSPQSNYNSPGLLSVNRLYNPLIYARDIYQIGPQEVLSFYLTWNTYTSYETTKDPKIRCIGGVIHCHFLQHNDSNSMIISYYVDSSNDCTHKQLTETKN